MTEAPKIFPLGDSAVTVDFGNEISLSLNDRAVALATHFNVNRFSGFIEAVPAYSSVAIFYDLVKVGRSFSGFGTAFDAVRTLVVTALDQATRNIERESRQIEIPVDFTGAAALDLDFIADHSGLAPSEVVDLFISKSYRVFMLGFLPGFAYMGEVDERVAVPRKDSPRKHVPKGSVGIAGRQTGIYPLESPGGWQIIGRTEMEMFTPYDESPCTLGAGDEVRFVPI